MKNNSLFQIATIIIIAANCYGDVLATALDFPNPNIQANKFDYTASFRQNMCVYQDAYDNGTVELRNALNGAQLNVAIGFDEEYVNLRVVQDTRTALDPTDPGLMIDILDEVATRSGFTWRNSFILEGNPYTDEEGNPYEQDKDWSDLLQWSTETYDVSARWWLNIPSRIAEGASFPKGWYDSNLIIIAKKDEDTFFEGSVFRPFSWGAPFTAGVWVSLFFTLVFTGITFGYIENKKLLQRGRGATTTNTTSTSTIASDRLQNLKGRKYLNATIFYIHESFIVFTGHLDLSPRTNSGRIVSFSLSLFAMLIVLTYGANLASFLVIQRAAFLTKIDTVNDIVRMSKSMCVYQDTATFEVISNLYSNAIIVSKQSEKETLLGLKAGDCNYAILGQSAWDTYERMEEVNSECPLVQIGRVFKRYESGFSMRSDAGKKCTSIVRNVFNLHLQEMHDTGFIEKAWAEHVNKKQDMIDPSCLPGVGSSDESVEGVERLDLTNLGGIFMFHFVFLLTAFFCSATGTRLAPLKRQVSASSKGSSESNHADDVSYASEPNHIDGNSDTVGTSESHRMDMISRTVEEHSLMLEEISSLLRELNKKVGADNVSPHSRRRITSDEESNQQQSKRILQVFCPPGDSTQD
jgi:hypothetical protein